MTQWPRRLWRAGRSAAEWMGWVRPSPESQARSRRRWKTDLSDKTIGRLQIVGLSCTLVVHVAVTLLYVFENEWSTDVKAWIRLVIGVAVVCLVGILIFVLNHRVPATSNDNGTD